jgi:hypothetical protein
MLDPYIAGIKTSRLIDGKLDGSFCPRSKVNFSLGSPTLSFSDYKLYGCLYLTHGNAKVSQNLRRNPQFLSCYSQ